MSGQGIEPAGRAAVLNVPQSARLDMRFGKRVRISAGVAVTPAGLLAIAALVSGILLSSAEIVRVARRPR